MAGGQGVVLFLSLLVLVSLFWWAQVEPTCWIKTSIQLQPAYQQSQWMDVESLSTAGQHNVHQAENIESIPRECEPKQEVIFAKTHKTGGTSVQVGILFLQNPHNQSEYSVQSW